jgi:hypothetical protein
MRAIILGAKSEECRRCGHVGPHLLVRKTHWFTVFRIPVVLLWVSHGILCPACGDNEGLSFMRVRAAMKQRFLPLDRRRPHFDAAVAETLGVASAEDWRAFGLPPGSDQSEIRSRWRDLAKALHPDHGGDVVAFARMQAVHQRLSQGSDRGAVAQLDAHALFDPVVVNRDRGPFDKYLKVWPFLAGAVLIFGMAQPPRPVSSTQGVYPPPVTNQNQAPAGAVGNAHTCWAVSGTIYGCRRTGSTTMLFGTTTGAQVTCWFYEPLQPNQYASCR